MLRFVNEAGIGCKTRILDDDGNDIGKMLCIGLGAKVTIGDIVKVDAELLMIKCDVRGRVSWRTKHPVSGEFVEVRSFQFSDGTGVVFDDDGTPRVHQPVESIGSEYITHVGPKPNEV